jgi:DNA-binding CsgD family transcriptional regulator
MIPMTTSNSISVKPTNFPVGFAGGSGLIRMPERRERPTVPYASRPRHIAAIIDKVCLMDGSIENSDLDGSSLASVFTREDVENMIAFLSSLIVSTDPLVAKRQRAFEWIAGAIEADVWVWLQSRFAEGHSFPVAIGVAEGGFRDDAERNSFHQANCDPELYGNLNPLFRTPTPLSMLQYEFFPKPPEAEPVLARWQKTTGLIDCVFSSVPAGNGVWSCIGLHRRRGGPPFTQRDRSLVHVMFGQLAFMHRPATDFPANNSSLAELTARRQQVLMYLLSGDQAKQIARKLQLSIHTVNGHVKDLYRHFSVATRAELINHFRTGGQPTFNQA